MTLGIRTALVPAAAVILFLGSPVASRREATEERQVVIVTPQMTDGRFVATREAIAFWNQTLAELKRRARLVEGEVLVAPPISRRLENYAQQIWRLAGYSVPEGGGPPPPRELTDLDGDIIVFLSRQVIFSFAWPIAPPRRFFIAIRTDSQPPLSYPNVSRNVIAHELGHTLGLMHNGDGPALMCGPCQQLLYRSDHPRFFPLTPRDRARLLELSPAE